MPVFDDMMAAAQTEDLQTAAPKGAPVLVARRCVRRLHQAAACAKCAEACPVNAIEIHTLEVRVLAQTCMGCGACAAACPADALYMRSPGVGATDAFVEKMKSAETLSVACEEASKDARRMADLVVPCIATMEKSIVAELLAHRADDAFALHFIRGACQKCARRTTCADALSIVKGWKAIWAKAAPKAELVEHEAPKGVDHGRREFWGRLLRKADIDVKPDVPFDEASLAWIDTVPERALPPTRLHWMAALKMAEAKSPELLSALMAAPGRPVFTAPKIDNDACTACGLCTTVCPTEALTQEEVNGLTIMKVTPSKCISCGLCRDICVQKAVQMFQIRNQAAALSEKPAVVVAKRTVKHEAEWEEKLVTMINPGVPVYRT